MVAPLFRKGDVTHFVSSGAKSSYAQTQPNLKVTVEAYPWGNTIGGMYWYWVVDDAGNRYDIWECDLVYAAKTSGGGGVGGLVHVAQLSATGGTCGGAPPYDDPQAGDEVEAIDHCSPHILVGQRYQIVRVGATIVLAHCSDALCEHCNGVKAKRTGHGEGGFCSVGRESHYFKLLCRKGVSVRQFVSVPAKVAQPKYPVKPCDCAALQTKGMSLAMSLGCAYVRTPGADGKVHV